MCSHGLEPTDQERNRRRACEIGEGENTIGYDNDYGKIGYPHILLAR